MPIHQSRITCDPAIALLISLLAACLLCSKALCLPEARAAESVAVIEVPGGHQVRHFAVRELARYLKLMTGSNVQADATTVARHRIFVGGVPSNLSSEVAEKLRSELAGLSEDGFIVRSVGSDVVVLGKGERGELYGCYAFLERQGVRWFFPGKDHEVIPRHKLIWPLRLNIVESPAFPERILFYWPHSYTAFEDWIDFAAKARLNRIAVLYTWPARDWYILRREMLLPEFEKRGLSIEVGGHFLSSFLPRALFKDHPDWFRKNEKGERTPKFNLDPFSAEALDYVGSSTVEYLRQTPEARLFHLWADDLPGGGWTHEADKEDYSASDQVLLVSNDLIARLRRVLPGANLAFLAYHDTVYPPNIVKPEPGVIYVYAPRERCYGHSLDSPVCPLNRLYSQALEKGLSAFGAANSEVFEYYVDQILYANFTNPPLPDVLAADLRYYHRLGIPRVGALMTNTAEFVTPMVNMFIYPQALWNPKRDLHESIREYAQTYFGDSSLSQYFDQVSVGLQEVLKVCEYTIPGDAWHATRVDQESDRALSQRIERIETALRGPLTRAEANLRAAADRAKGGVFRTRLSGELKSMRFTLFQVRLYYHLLKGEWLYRLWKDQRDPEAGLGSLRELVLSWYILDLQREFVTRAEIKGQPHVPDPDVLEERSKELVRDQQYSVDHLDQHLAKGVRGAIVSGPSGSAAILWADPPGGMDSIRPGNSRLSWTDEFGQPLGKTQRSRPITVIVINAPRTTADVLFNAIAKSQESK